MNAKKNNDNKKNIDKLNISIALITILWVLNLWLVSYSISQISNQTVNNWESWTIWVNYNELKKIVKEEILANEYEKMWGKENFDAINEMQIPQIEAAVAQFKAQKQQIEEAKKPKFLEADKVKEIIAAWYNEWKDDADILWLEYSDLECPYCAMFHNSNATQMVVDKYGDKVSHSFRHFPLNGHQNAMPAALVAECAGAEKWAKAYYEVIDKSFTSKKSDLASMLTFAEEVWVNKTKVKICVENETYKEKINSQFNLWKGEFSITWTPAHIIINTKTGKYLKVSWAVWGGELIDAIEKIK